MRSSHIGDVARAFELAERPQGVRADELARLSNLRSPSWPSAVRRARFVLKELVDEGFLVAVNERSTEETPLRGRPHIIYYRAARRAAQTKEEPSA